MQQKKTSINYSITKAESDESLLYVGSSMYPTLQNLDVLKLSPYQGRKIGSGDVIVFRSPDDEKKIVHRVVSSEADGIRTRGDNCKAADPSPVDFNDIIGQVVQARRGVKILTVHGGSRGRIIGILTRGRKGIRLRKRLLLLLQPVIVIILKSGFIRRLFFGDSEPQVFLFQRSGGLEMQLLLGRRIIGSCTGRSGKWEINPRYRAFVDENTLPAWNTTLQNKTDSGQLSIETAE